MINSEINPDEDFTVKESSLFNYLIGFLIVFILLAVLWTRDIIHNYKPDGFYMIYLTLIIAALGAFMKAKREQVIVKVNRSGLYYKGKFITNWENFINAYITQESYNPGPYSAGVTDNFKIKVYFCDPKKGTEYVCTMAMSTTQDKSEYEVISAIKNFSGRELSFDIV